MRRARTEAIEKPGAGSATPPGPPLRRGGRCAPLRGARRAGVAGPLAVVCLVAALLTSKHAVAADAPAGDLRAVGVARVDITPDYPVRLSGFGFRRTES